MMLLYFFSLILCLTYTLNITKLTPSLQNHLKTPHNSTTPLKIWIHFNTKYYTNPSLLRGHHGDLVDDKDLEVPPEFVKAVEAVGAKIMVRSKWINAVSALVVTENVVEDISEFYFVKKIELVRKGKKRRERGGEWKEENGMDVTNIPEKRLANQLDYGYSNSTLSMVNIIKAHEEGLTGKGIRILILDSGFYIEHKSIPHKQVIDQYDFVNDDDETKNQDGDTSTQMSHGTSVLSLIIGKSSGKIMGAAYEAEVLLAKTESLSFEKPIEEDHFVAGLEWGVNLGARVVSSSLGYHDWWHFEDYDGQHSVASRAVDIASSEKGVVVVMAIGNYYESSITTPADARACISIGSVGPTGQPSSFSSVGPTADGRIKPEILAPGENIYLADFHTQNGFIRNTGTSFSTPIIAGGVALILQKNPSWNPGQVKEALIKTASLAQQYKNRTMQPDGSLHGMTVGFGIANIWAAANYQHGDCESSCLHGTCVLGNCVCSEGYYNYDCDTPYLHCHEWCFHGKCFEDKCLCLSSHPKRCISKLIPGWTCDLDDYNDTLVCNFCGPTPDPDCQGYTTNDCPDLPNIQIDKLYSLCTHPQPLPIPDLTPTSNLTPTPTSNLTPTPTSTSNLTPTPTSNLTPTPTPTSTTDDTMPTLTPKIGFVGFVLVAMVLVGFVMALTCYVTVLVVTFMNREQKFFVV